MTPQNNLDLKGNFQKTPFAELLVEIIQSELSGSLRLCSAKKKLVIYFRDGTVVYAVSNVREQRLFSVMLGRKKIDEKTLARFPNFANDLELAADLEENRIFTKSEVDELIQLQIEEIIIDALTWQTGEWVFSPLTRLREDLIYRPDVHRILIDYARCLPAQEVSQKFKSVHEAFHRVTKPVSTGALLQGQEQYALDLFNGTQLTIEDLRPTCSLPETAMLQSLYVLWLGGLLVRHEWNSAFSSAKIREILNARVSRKQEAAAIKKPAKAEPTEPEAAVEPEAEPARSPEPEISLEDYLDRVEKAETFYDLLGVADKAPISDIKTAYFSMAKLFHPDRFHREETAKLRRIQVAFTKIAQAYETLKTPEGREHYDFKMRKELEVREKRRLAGQITASETPEDRKAEHGLDSFESAMEALNEEEFAAAAGHLARAVHYSPQNALFHAYFGYALSQLEKQHHKAEASLQTAVKLDPTNPKIRMMLVDFFIEMKMTKRAVGELKRFLELVPNNTEASKLLARMQGDTPE